MKSKKCIAENPTLMAEWDWDTNGANGFNPCQITCGSDKRISWICPKCKMSYFARIPDRIGKSCGCPYCAGKRPIPGVNDLESWCKENRRTDLLKEWRPELNKGKCPSEFLFASNKKIVWECARCHHRWEQQIDQRTLRGTGCKRCRITGTSFPEQFIYLILKSIIGNVQNGYRGLGFEIDIYIEPLNIAIEYNGEYFHKTRDRKASDRKKKLECKERGVYFLQIEEHRAEIKQSAQEGTISWKYSREKENVSSLAKCVLKWINDQANQNYTIGGIDVDDIYQYALKTTYGVRAEKSLAYKFPDVAAEWDYEKNGDIVPENVPAGSHDIYYWICSVCGHTWAAKVNDRTHGHGCYVCGRHKQVEAWRNRSVSKHNFRDWCLENNRKLLLAEWDYDANEGRGPESFSAGSNEAVSWVCNVCGNRYSAKISNRKKGTGCKSCWNQRRKTIHQNDVPVRSDNALVAWCIRNHREELLEQWDFSKNEFPPENYTYGSQRVVYWKCDCGHEWATPIKARTSQGNGCKGCSNTKRERKAYENDLKDRF